MKERTVSVGDFLAATSCGAMMSAGKADDFKVKIRRWLLDDGWTLEDATPLPEAKVHWVLRCRWRASLPEILVSFDRSPERVSMHTSFILEDDAINAWTRLEPSERSHFLVDLKLDLFGRGMIFDLDDSLLQITLAQRVYLEGFTRDLFFDRLTKARTSYLYTGLLCLRKLGLAEYQFGISTGSVN